MTTGERIREARLRAGMTQGELAEIMGIPYQGIGQWERNKRKPKLETIERLADALGTSRAMLLGLPDGPDRNPDLEIDRAFQRLLEAMGYCIDSRFGRKGFYFGKLGVGDGPISPEEYAQLRDRILECVVKIADETVNDAASREYKRIEDENKQMEDMIARIKAETGGGGLLF